MTDYGVYLYLSIKIKAVPIVSGSASTADKLWLFAYPTTSTQHQIGIIAPFKASAQSVSAK